MNIFSYLDYRTWLREWISQRPNNGYGELSKLAANLTVNSTLISQVLSKSRDFSVEHGFALCRYCALNPLETRYFMTLLYMERAGNEDLKNYYKKEIKDLQRQAGLIQNRVEVDREVSDSDKSYLVSSWKPTAMLVFTGVSTGVSADEMAQRFKLDLPVVREILEKLVEMGLVEQRESRFFTGLKRLHIPKGSSFLQRHYANWRLKAIEQSDQIDDEEVMYTSVSSIAKSDIPIFKEKILNWISEYAKNVSASPAEQVVCFNLDFFKIGK